MKKATSGLNLVCRDEKYCLGIIVVFGLGFRAIVGARNQERFHYCGRCIRARGVVGFGEGNSSGS